MTQQLAPLTEAFPIEDDPELAALAVRLRETASYAINPTFKKELRKALLKQFAAHWTGETRLIEEVSL